MHRFMIISCIALILFLSACQSTENKSTSRTEQTTTNTTNAVQSNTTIEAAPSTTPEEEKQLDEQHKSAYATDKLKNGPKNDGVMPLY